MTVPHNVFKRILLLPLIPLLGAAMLPPPDDSLPRSPSALARDLERTDDGLRHAIAAWRRADPALLSAARSRDVQLQALHQQRLMQLLTDTPSLGRRVLSRLRGSARRASEQTLAAMADLKRLAPAHPRPRRWRTGPALPAGRLRAYYAEGQRRFGVGWHVLAAVNFVETGFNKLRNDSTSGAKGPMQFLPSTWRGYGLGGDVRDPRDAILGAANHLRANGAPGSYRRALFAYNPSRLYVDAVMRYAQRMRRSPNAFLSYYSWQVFVRGPDGRRRRLTGPR